jgi:hypothetical protein
MFSLSIDFFGGMQLLRTCAQHPCGKKNGLVGSVGKKVFAL